MNSDLLKKYLDGQCTPEEEQAVLKYLEEGNEEEVHRHILSLEETVDSRVRDMVSESLLADIHSSINARGGRGILSKIRRWQVAAGITILLAVSGIAFWSSRPKLKEQEQDEWISLRNDGQEVKKVSMPDGTSIWLNARAALSYNESAYNHKDREVTVTGEAFFDVAGDPGRPFRVKTGNVTTVVLGTAFNIEHYENENDIRVTLVQGKVEISADREKYVLSPGQLMSYNVEKHSMEVRSTDIGSTREWLSGQMVFNDLPLADVLKRVATTYKVDIVCQQPLMLEGKRLTGTYMRKPPAELLSKILFVHGLHLEEKSGKFIIRP